MFQRFQSSNPGYHPEETDRFEQHQYPPSTCPFAICARDPAKEEGDSTLAYIIFDVTMWCLKLACMAATVNDHDLINFMFLNGKLHLRPIQPPRPQRLLLLRLMCLLWWIWPPTLPTRTRHWSLAASMRDSWPSLRDADDLGRLCNALRWLIGRIS